MNLSFDWHFAHYQLHTIFQSVLLNMATLWTISLMFCMS